MTKQTQNLTYATNKFKKLKCLLFLITTELALKAFNLKIFECEALLLIKSL